MNNRRKFIFQSGIAATAVLVAKPFNIFAKVIAPYSLTSTNKVVFAHTGNYNSANRHQTINHIADLKNSTGNLVLLHAGHSGGDNAGYPGYDASMNPESNASLATGNYKIIYKGKIKIGVISAGPGMKNPSAEINALSSRLKKEKNCDLVICLSQLGYKNKNKMDDITLAEESTDIDAIIGGHAENFSRQPVIAMNKNETEVIINHAAGNKLAFRKIEIDFDDNRKKKHIAFTKTVPGSREAKHS